MSYRLVILGDICPQWGFPDLFSTRNPEKVFHNILPVLKNADYVVANLECPATDSNSKLDKNSINLKARPSDIEVLYNAGIRAVSLANNHILDYGVKGLNDTINTLSKVGIAHYGAGTVNSAADPFFLNVQDFVIGFIAFAEHEFNCAIDYGVGASKWDDIYGLNAIRNAKKKCDYLIVQYHGGIENYKYPSPLLQKKCRAMAEVGADYITCQHSHIIGTREKWGSAEIIYGQGNTVFGYNEKNGSWWNNGLMCVVDIKRNGKQIVANTSYVPIVALSDGEYLADNETKKTILSAFESDSLCIKDDGFVSDQWKCYCEKISNSYLPMCFAWTKNMVRANKLLNGMLIKLLVGKKQKRNAMNIIRCDAHREVITTILENNYYYNQ